MPDKFMEQSVKWINKDIYSRRATSLWRGVRVVAGRLGYFHLYLIYFMRIGLQYKQVVCRQIGNFVIKKDKVEGKSRGLRNCAYVRICTNEM